MENTNPNSESSELYNIAVTEAATYYLRETSKWAKFLSIVGFVVSALTVLGGFFAGSIVSALSAMGGGEFGGVAALGAGMGVFFGIIYILVGLLYFFPSLYLYRFSEKTKIALSTMDSRQLAEAMKNQKSFFKFWGMLVAIMLGLYALLFLLSIVFGAVMGA